MAKQAKRAVSKRPKKRGRAVEETPVAQPEPTDVPEAPAVVKEYPQCSCGARLVLAHEIESGQCESCSGAHEHLGDDGEVYPTAEAAEAAGVDVETATRVNVAVQELLAQHLKIEALNQGIEDSWKQNTKDDQARRKTLAAEAAQLEDAYDSAWEHFAASLPESFPFDVDDMRSQVEGGTWAPLPVPQVDAPAEAAPATVDPFQPTLPGIRPPFDIKAALEDICAKQRAIDATRKRWEELHKQAGDLKKQIDAQVDTLSKAIAEYDQARREAEAEAVRQEQLLAAYEQKAAEDAAKKAAEPEPSEPCEKPAVTADPAANYSSLDGLSICACGRCRSDNARLPRRPLDARRPARPRLLARASA